VEELIPQITFHSLGEPVLSSFQNIFRWNQFKDIIDQIEPHVYFSVHFERGLPKGRFTPVNSDLKTAVMVHDLIPMIDESFATKGFMKRYLKKLFFMEMWTAVPKAD